MPTRSRHPRPEVDVYEPSQPLVGSMTGLGWGVRVSVTGLAPGVARLPDDPMAKSCCFLKKDLSMFGDSHASDCGSITNEPLANGNVFLDSWPLKTIKCYGNTYILKGWNWLLFSTSISMPFTSDQHQGWVCSTSWIIFLFYMGLSKIKCPYCKSAGESFSLSKWPYIVGKVPKRRPNPCYSLGYHGYTSH